MHVSRWRISVEDMTDGAFLILRRPDWQRINWESDRLARQEVLDMEVGNSIRHD